ncbi:187-kDa microtubule-associated protein AIR9 [Rosa chinensis]|nr:187-kDa microtubule-associated protein AIR9 [Rosa chinensis]
MNPMWMMSDTGFVAIYTPVREDGVEGSPVSASTEPIAVEPDVLKEVKQKLDLGSVKFEALCDKDQSTKKTTVVGTLERRTLEVNRKRVKVIKPGSKTSFPTTEIRGSYAPPFHVELFRNDQHRLRIVGDSESVVDLMVQSRHVRDVIVLVIRGFAQRFNSTSLNTLLKIEHNM